MKSLAALLVVLFAFAGPAVAQAAKDCLTGSVQLTDPIAAQLPPGGTLFVYIRETGRKTGPPSAVVTIRNPVYPQNFTLCGSDQMVPGTPAQPLDGHYRVYARHSLTGAPMRREGFLGTTTGASPVGIRRGQAARLTIDRPLAP